MSDHTHPGLGSFTRRRGALSAALLVAVAGASFALAQSSTDPFSGADAADSQVKVSEFLTVDLHVQDEDLANVLQMLSLQSQRNIVVSNDVSATVSANLYNVTFYEALDAILNVNGYGYVEQGNFIYVYTLEEIASIEKAKRKPIAKMIKLNYLNGNDAAEFVTPLLSEDGQIKTNGDPDTFSIPDDAPTGDETFALSATLVVYDYPEQVEEIESLLHQLDTRPSQVLVEATILQSALNEANAFGVDFSLIGDVGFSDFTNTGGPLSAISALQKGGTGSSSGGFSPADNVGGALVSSPGNTAGASTFKIGIVKHDFSVFLKMLDEVSDISILSNPKILTLNRQPARVLVGRRIGFLNTTSTQTSTTQTVQFLDTGTQLAFRPFITNEGMVRMELKPRVSEGVIRDTTDASGVSVSIPDEITQELSTNVIVRDGNTIVLGGLFKETTKLSRRQVPLFGDIPVLGLAFRGHDDSTDRAEIIFMITPTIMNDETLLAEGERAIETVQNVRTGTREGLLPWSRSRLTAQLNLEADRLARNGDTRKALWKISRSLELSHNQSEAVRLRRRLLNDPEIWPSRSILEDVLDEELFERLEEIEPVSKSEPAINGVNLALAEDTFKAWPSKASSDANETQDVAQASAGDNFVDWSVMSVDASSAEADSTADFMANASDAGTDTSEDDNTAPQSTDATADASEEAIDELNLSAAGNFNSSDATISNDAALSLLAVPGLSQSFPLPMWLDPDWMLVKQSSDDSKAEPFMSEHDASPSLTGIWEAVRARLEAEEEAGNSSSQLSSADEETRDDK